MTPFVQLQIVRARLEGVNGTLCYPDGKRGNDQIQVAVQELGVLAHALDAVQPIEATASIRVHPDDIVAAQATTTIQSSYAVATADLDLVSDALIELGDSAITFTRRMELVRAIRSLLKIS